MGLLLEVQSIHLEIKVSMKVLVTSGGIVLKLKALTPKMSPATPNNSHSMIS